MHRARSSEFILWPRNHWQCKSRFISRREILAVVCVRVQLMSMNQNQWHQWIDSSSASFLPSVVTMPPILYRRNRNAVDKLHLFYRPCIWPSVRKGTFPSSLPNRSATPWDITAASQPFNLIFWQSVLTRQCADLSAFLSCLGSKLESNFMVIFVFVFHTKQ